MWGSAAIGVSAFVSSPVQTQCICTKCKLLRPSVLKALWQLLSDLQINPTLTEALQQWLPLPFPTSSISTQCFFPLGSKLLVVLRHSFLPPCLPMSMATSNSKFGFQLRGHFLSSDPSGYLTQTLVRREPCHSCSLLHLTSIKMPGTFLSTRKYESVSRVIWAILKNALVSTHVAGR